MIVNDTAGSNAQNILLNDTLPFGLTYDSNSLMVDTDPGSAVFLTLTDAIDADSGSVISSGQNYIIRFSIATILPGEHVRLLYRIRVGS